MPSRILLIVCSLALLLPAACSSTPARSTTHAGPIRNLHVLSPGLYSGDEPATQHHYQQLSSLGIKTVISVDAVAPDPDLASKHGIKIVHLPIGYDGIEDPRAAELASAIAQLEHPIYLHCHHGKHRGPAALCVGAIGAGIITNDQAIEFMTLAGTSDNYPGLWSAAQNARPLDQPTLDSITEFPTRAPVTGFVQGMGTLDRLHDQLLDIADNDWNAPDDHPDLSATAISGQLYDHLRSMGQLEYFNRKGTMLRSRFEAITELARTTESKIIDEDFTGALESLDALSDSCLDCHERFRD